MMKVIDIDKVVRDMNGDLYGRWSEKVGGDHMLREIVERVMYYAEEQMSTNASELYTATIDELTHSSQFYKEMYDQLATYMVEHSRDLTSFAKELKKRIEAEQ